jgi:AraC-like DNA-binding protein
MSDIKIDQPEGLDSIQSLFGRVSYLAACRDPQTRVYALPAGATFSITDEVQIALGRLHRSLFLEWLNLSLERQAADMKTHFDNTASDRHIKLQIWNEPEAQRALLPDHTRPGEEAFFLSELRLLALLLNSPTQTIATHSSDHHLDWRVGSAIAEVQRQCSQNHLTLKTLSPRLRLSPRHLGRLFLRQTGLSFHQYLRTVRLTKAADLLRALSLSVKEVSAAVGYSSVSNFSRDFSSTAGLSPARYREHRIAVTPDS